MYAKIKITGCLEVVTGLHIGTSGAFSAIGAVDSPVVRDAWDRNPMIPGSSLKGKMRTLLARQYNEKPARSPEEDDEKLLRLFGSASKDTPFKTGRLLFSDMALSNAVELRKRGADSLTEVKFENAINRLTAEANPRQVERVVRGSKFGLELIYERNGQRAGEMTEDFAIICDGLRLLQYDYLGGSGSRGYGKVRFSGLTAKTIVGELETGMEGIIREMVEKVGEGSGV